MHIGIFGAGGTIGQRVVAEALARGHAVTAFARDASRVPAGRGDVTWKVADVLDAGSIADRLGGLDVLVNAYGPGPSSNAAGRYSAESIEDAVRNAGSLVTAARALLKALERRPALRLVVVGGAGSLEVAPGLQGVDSGPGLVEGLRELGLPEAYKAVVLAHREALDLYRISNRNWTYFSPAHITVPGERTGRFRLGGDQPVVGADGASRVSCEDYAAALLDEIELPRHVQRRFTVGYLGRAPGRLGAAACIVFSLRRTLVRLAHKASPAAAPRRPGARPSIRGAAAPAFRLRGDRARVSFKGRPRRTRSRPWPRGLAR